jgi:uncharacterized membrane protein YjgN (DUF898 family)
MKTPDQFWKKIPRSSLAVFLLGVFSIFSIIGSAVDLMGMGLQPTSRYLASVLLFGIFAIVYATAEFMRRGLSWKIIFPVMLVQMLVIGQVVQKVPLPHEMGTGEIVHLHSRLILNAALVIGGMVLAYICFTARL